MTIKSIILIASLSSGLLFANEPLTPVVQRNQIEKSIIEVSKRIVPQKIKVEALEAELQKEKLDLKKLEEDLEAQTSKLKAWHETQKLKQPDQDNPITRP